MMGFLSWLFGTAKRPDPLADAAEGYLHGIREIRLVDYRKDYCIELTVEGGKAVLRPSDGRHVSQIRLTPDLARALGNNLVLTADALEAEAAAKGGGA